MSFTSFSFVPFLLIAVTSFHLLPGRWRPLCLFVASYAFYATWSAPHAALLFMATTGTYLVGRAISSSEGNRQRRWLAVGVVGLVGLLCAFKYAGELGATFMRFGYESGGLTRLAVPIGISYYTFKLLSYLIDVYWEKVPAEKDFIAFAAYVAFFPQILSGPIQRARDFLPQATSGAAVTPDYLSSGLRLILFGLFKKLVVADNLAGYVDQVFDNPAQATWLGALLGSYLFALQLYADFSGLANIAIGVGRLFGIETPPNFNRPFSAPNIQEFWRRWHITLSSWLADYVFAPLRMRLRYWDDVGLAIALTVNMMAIGLWHGARSSYLMFGAINSVYLIVSAFTLKRRNRAFKNHPSLSRLRRFFGPLFTFHMVVFAFVFFRAQDVETAVTLLSRFAPAFEEWPRSLAAAPAWLHVQLHGLNGPRVRIGIFALPVIALVHLIDLRGWGRKVLLDRPIWFRWTVYYVATMAIIGFAGAAGQQFIYARF